MSLEEQYPEHGKVTAVQEKSQAIGEFLEWLQSQGVILCRLNERSEEYWPDNKDVNTRLAEYFGIDLKRLNEEKAAMIASIRAAVEGRAA